MAQENSDSVESTGRLPEELVSVGVVTYHADQNLSSLLTSLKAQTWQVQVLVVDGANSPSTEEICQSFEVKYFKSQCNDIGKNRQTIVEACGTPFVAFVDTDCLPESESWIECMTQQLVQLRQEKTATAGFGGGQIFVDEVSGQISPWNIYQCSWLSLGSPQFARSSIALTDHIPTNNAVFHVSSLQDCGGFESTPFNVGEDLAMGWSLNKSKFCLYKGGINRVRHQVRTSAWWKKMYSYGRAQSWALKQVRCSPGMRFSVCLFFLPVAGVFALFCFQLFMASVLLFVLAITLAGWKRFGLKESFHFSLQALAGYFFYSLGVWRQLLAG